MGNEARKSVEEIYAFDIVEFWVKIFNDIVGKSKVERDQVDTERLAVAVDMMLNFSASGVESREMERTYWVQKSSSGINNNSNYIRELEEIYEMRTWKLIQKYRKFMDETKLGKLTSSIRDLIIKRK